MSARDEYGHGDVVEMCDEIDRLRAALAAAEFGRDTYLEVIESQRAQVERDRPVIAAARAWHEHECFCDEPVIPTDAWWANRARLLAAVQVAVAALDGEVQ